jgi:hypothetical protein
MASRDLSLSQRIEIELTAIRRTMIDLIAYAGLTHRELEQRLTEKGCSIDLDRLFRGEIDLQCSHLLAICMAAGLAPGDFLAARKRGHRLTLVQGAINACGGCSLRPTGSGIQHASPRHWPAGRRSICTPSARRPSYIRRRW